EGMGDGDRPSHTWRRRPREAPTAGSWPPGLPGGRNFASRTGRHGRREDADGAHRSRSRGMTGRPPSWGHVAVDELPPTWGSALLQPGEPSAGLTRVSWAPHPSAAACNTTAPTAAAPNAIGAPRGTTITATNA